MKPQPKPLRWLLSLGAGIALLTGCASQDREQYAAEKPTLDLAR